MTQAFCTEHSRRRNPAKLAELRRKTDQQLLSLFHSKMDMAFGLAILAEVERSVGDPANAEQSLANAEQALLELERLLPVLNVQKRLTLDSNLDELRQAVAVARLSRTRDCRKTQTASLS